MEVQRRRARTDSRSVVGRRARDTRIRIGGQIRTLREDSGIGQRALASAAKVDAGFISQIERGEREPSLSVLTAIATALGADLSVKLYPGTGPRIRDAIQSRIVEALLRIVDPRWDRMVEVPVVRPARGFVDVVLLDRLGAVAACTEVHSELRRLEQLIRWANEKSLSLPSADLWQRLDDTPRIDRLLIVRSTQTNRDIVNRFATTLATAYPADSSDAYRALTTPDAPWPGSAILWASVEGDRAVILERPPRTVSLGP